MSTVAGLECNGRCAYTCAARLGGPVWGSACFAYSCPLFAAATCINTVAGPHLIENGVAKCVAKETLEKRSACVLKYSTIAPNMTPQLYRSLKREGRSDGEDPCYECLVGSLAASCFGIFCSVFAALWSCCPPEKDVCGRYQTGGNRALEVGRGEAPNEGFLEGLLTGVKTVFPQPT